MLKSLKCQSYDAWSEVLQHYAIGGRGTSPHARIAADRALSIHQPVGNHEEWALVLLLSSIGESSGLPRVLGDDGPYFPERQLLRLYDPIASVLPPCFEWWGLYWCNGNCLTIGGTALVVRPDWSTRIYDAVVDLSCWLRLSHGVTHSTVWHLTYCM